MLIYFFNMKSVWVFRILMKRKIIENVTVKGKSDKRGKVESVYDLREIKENNFRLN